MSISTDRLNEIKRAHERIEARKEAAMACTVSELNGWYSRIEGPECCAHCGANEWYREPSEYRVGYFSMYCAECYDGQPLSEHDCEVEACEDWNSRQ